MDPYRLANQYERDEALNQAGEPTIDLTDQGFEWEIEGPSEETVDGETSPDVGSEYEMEQSLSEEVQVNADLSDLEAEHREAERGRISLPEALIVTFAAAFTDFFELITAFSGAFPLAGLVSVAKGLAIVAKAKTLGWIGKITGIIAKFTVGKGILGSVIAVIFKGVSLITKAFAALIQAGASGLIAIGSALFAFGVLWWFFTFSFGLIVSACIVMWSIFRGGHYMLLRRLIIILAGVLLDAATGGAIPTRTLAVIIVIWLNNKSANENVRKIQTKIEGALTALSRLPI